MIPFLLLDQTTRREVEDLLEKKARGEEMFEGLRATLEELGDQEDWIKRVFGEVELSGGLESGALGEILVLMAGESRKDVDWRRIPRRRRKKLR